MKIDLKVLCSIICMFLIFFVVKGNTISKATSISEMQNLKSYMEQGTAPGVNKIAVNMMKNDIKKYYSLNKLVPDEEKKHNNIPYKIGQNLLYFEKNSNGDIFLQQIVHTLSKQSSYNDIKKVFGASKFKDDGYHGFREYHVGKYLIHFETEDIKNTSSTKYKKYSIVVDNSFTPADFDKFSKGTIKDLYGKIGMNKSLLIKKGIKQENRAYPTPKGVAGYNLSFSKTLKNNINETYYVNSKTNKITLVIYTVPDTSFNTPIYTYTSYKTNNKKNIEVFKVKNSSYYVAYDASDISQISLGTKAEILNYLGAKKLIKR